MKIGNFIHAKSNKPMWTTTHNGRKFMASQEKYLTEQDFEQFVLEETAHPTVQPAQLDKWPAQFVGKGDYRGQIFERIEEYKSYMIYKWWPASNPSSITYDLFPSKMKSYPDPEKFQDPAYTSKTIDAAKSLIDILSKQK